MLIFAGSRPSSSQVFNTLKRAMIMYTRIDNTVWIPVFFLGFNMSAELEYSDICLLIRGCLVSKLD